jgi:hypothetical protein
MQDLAKQFDATMFEIYRRAKLEADYSATIFLRMIGDRGGLATAKYLINSPTPSDGYTQLYQRGRLDLTVEAMVVENPKWHELFTREEVAAASRRLQRYGYRPRTATVLTVARPKLSSDVPNVGNTAGTRGMSKTENRQTNIASLIAGFPRYLSVFEQNPPFRRYGQLEYHVETIQRRREVGSVATAVHDDQFLATLYKTLQAWGIGARASKLTSFAAFVSALRAKTSEMAALENRAIDDPEMNVNETGQQLWRLVNTLGIVDNDARMVAGSKALHHLLPELVVPIDRAYTQKFFCWQNPTFQYKQGTCFLQAFAGFAQIARQTGPGQYVGSGWHSSRTKIIDNALIGLIELSKRESANHE